MTDVSAFAPDVTGLLLGHHPRARPRPALQNLSSSSRAPSASLLAHHPVLPLRDPTGRCVARASHPDPPVQGALPSGSSLPHGCWADPGSSGTSSAPSSFSAVLVPPLHRASLPGPGVPSLHGPARRRGRPRQPGNALCTNGLSSALSVLPEAAAAAEGAGPPLPAASSPRPREAGAAPGPSASGEAMGMENGHHLPADFKAGGRLLQVHVPASRGRCHLCGDRAPTPPHPTPVCAPPEPPANEKFRIGR